MSEHPHSLTGLRETPPDKENAFEFSSWPSSFSWLQGFMCRNDDFSTNAFAFFWFGAWSAPRGRPCLQYCCFWVYRLDSLPISGPMLQQSHWAHLFWQKHAPNLASCSDASCRKNDKCASVLRASRLLGVINMTPVSSLDDIKSVSKAIWTDIVTSDIWSRNLWETGGVFYSRGC